MKHLKKFQTQAQCEAYMYGSNYVEPFVGLVAETSGISYNKVVQPPLTFNITSPGTIVWKSLYDGHGKTISYSIDNGATWTDITSQYSYSAPKINVNAGDKVMFKGDNATYCTYDSALGYAFNSFSGSTAGFEIEGNIMSLINSTGFETATTLTSANTFYGLFRYCTGLTSAENLVLPATILTSNCYNSMFGGCTSLTTAPSSIGTSASTMGVSGCTEMFYGCSSLTTAPELPVTTLANYCYSHMFYNCSSLTTAPELPATTLAYYCYQYMFAGCSGLTQAPELPATTLVSNCYKYMFYNCSSLTTAPELPATTLTYGCYQEMFEGCTSLNYIKCLATNISTGSPTSSWVENVSQTGTFVKNPNMSSWTTGNNGIPSGWTVQDA